MSTPIAVEQNARFAERSGILRGETGIAAATRRQILSRRAARLRSLLPVRR